MRPYALIDLGSRVRLFLSSYAALFCLLALRFHSSPWLAFSCLALTLVGGVTAWQAIHEAKGVEPRPQQVQLTAVADQGGDVAGYLATYLLPFLTVADPPLADVVAYVLFITLVGIIYVQSDMLHVNPTLYLFRYRIYTVTTADESAVLIAAKPVNVGVKLNPREVRAHLWILTN